MGEFDALSDLDFEDFVADLMSKVTGLEFEAGTRGRDKGIDCLAVVDGERHVIQCKHFIRSDFSDLKGKARKEAGRLAGLEEPYASYRFVTSRELNPTERAELVEILEPWVGSRENVLGGKELSVRLSKNKGVATHHPKLWFSGAAQLRRQLSAEQYERRGALLEEIRPRLPRFVETGAFVEARCLLREKRVCIVDGPPGVGKTTLAQLLLIDGLEDGFEPFEVQRGAMSKAWQLLDLDERQIFYFDDFLGHVSLSEARDEDQDLIRFIRRVAKDERRRFVLTTRDYIFTEARRKSEALYREVDDAHLFFLTPERYTRVERARIFYNHLHFSPQVDQRAKNTLVRRGHHLEVIDHENYSPRVIESITGFSGRRLTAEEKSSYGNFCLAVLGSPDDLWSNSLAELDDHQKALLFAFPGLDDRVTVAHLEAAFAAACAGRGLDVSEGRFQAALDALVGSFVSSTGSGDSQSFSLLNPSLLDVLVRHAVTSRMDTEAALRGACFFEQVEWLWDAWRKDAEAPPEHLWPAFDDALSRVLASPTTEPSRFIAQSGPVDNFHEKFNARLNTVLSWCEQPGLRDSFSVWLPTYAHQWLGELGEGGEIYQREIELFERLLGSGMLDRGTVGEEVKMSVRPRDPSISRWQMLGSLKGACPKALSDEDVAEETDALKTFIGLVLEDPAEFRQTEAFYGTEGLDELMEVASSWGIALDRAEVRSARVALLEYQEQEDEESEFIESQKGGFVLEAEERPPREAPVEDEISDEEAEIEAMFWRLVEERRPPASHSS